MLYALCLHPFLRTLETKLTGVTIGQRKMRVSVVAYGDDVTVFVKYPADILTILTRYGLLREQPTHSSTRRNLRPLQLGTGPSRRQYWG